MKILDSLVCRAAVAAICSGLPHVLAAQDGLPDPSFGSGGIVTTAVTGHGNGGRKVAIQDDGKIVVAGYANNGVDDDFAVVRYLEDGSLDNAFGTGGKVVTDIGGNDYAFALVIQGDGKILVGGYATVGANQDFALVRYTSAGALDNSFGSAGIAVHPMGNANDQIWSLGLQSDGKIMAGGVATSGFSQNFVLARYTSSGQLDATYGSAGKVIATFGFSTNHAGTILVQPDDRTVVTGYGYTPPPSGVSFALARYTSSGTLDASFGSNGIRTAQFGPPYIYSYGLGAALAPDGSIFMVGTGGQGGNWMNFGVMKFTPAGATDNTFGVGGKVLTSFPDAIMGEAESVSIQPDGKIVVAGELNDGGPDGQDFKLVRYLPNGTVDNTFGDAGVVTTAVSGFADYGFSSALQEDGKIVVAGFAGDGTSNLFAVVRYRNDIGASVAESPDFKDWKAYPNPAADHITLAFAAIRTGPSEVELFDMTGQRVRRFPYVVTEGLNDVRIPLEGLAPGVYSARVTQMGAARTVQFMHY